MSTQWLTVREVAAKMRLTPEEIRKRARNGELPGGVKDGRRTLFEADLIEAHMNSMPRAAE